VSVPVGDGEGICSIGGVVGSKAVGAVGSGEVVVADEVLRRGAAVFCVVSAAPSVVLGCPGVGWTEVSPVAVVSAVVSGSAG
jgi:hypothetical protein